MYQASSVRLPFTHSALSLEPKEIDTLKSHSLTQMYYCDHHTKNVSNIIL